MTTEAGTTPVPAKSPPAHGDADAPPRPRRRRPDRGIYGPQGPTGWLFISPAVIILGLFVLLPILMALFVSFTKWNGQGSPFTSGVPMAGTDNYTSLFTKDGLARLDFMTSIRNNAYYVLFVVPLQTVLALALALVVNNRLLKGKGFFRTTFYFPSVTSSVAISVVFLFLFTNSGAINAILAFFGVHGPAWFSDPRGVIQILLSALGLVDPDNPPAWLANSHLAGLSTWDWIAGPSVAMCAIIFLVVWTTSGTFMLMFLAGLQNVPVELDEAGMIDGATRWQRLRYITLPQLKPTLFLVITLGLIGTWQVFDQIYVMSQGNPAKTTLTPAYLSWRTAFTDFDYGPGAAISFILFGIIVVLTLFQRWVMRDKDKVRSGPRRRGRRPAVAADDAPAGALFGPAAAVATARTVNPQGGIDGRG